MRKLAKKIMTDIEAVKVVDIEEDKKGGYILNNGSTIQGECICKKNGTGKTVCIFAVTTDRKILLVIQPRVVLDAEDRVDIQLPTDYLEVGENSMDAAIRVLKDETAYITSDIFLVDSYYLSPEFSEERVDLFLALNCIQETDSYLDKEKIICRELVTLEEFEYLLNSSYIMNVNARVGYYRYLEYLMKEGY